MCIPHLQKPLKSCICLLFKITIITILSIGKIRKHVRNEAAEKYLSVCVEFFLDFSLYILKVLLDKHNLYQLIKMIEILPNVYSH